VVVGGRQRSSGVIGDVFANLSVVEARSEQEAADCFREHLSLVRHLLSLSVSLPVWVSSLGSSSRRSVVTAWRCFCSARC
jgi:hypothetical protein